MTTDSADLLIRIFPRRTSREPYPVEASLADGSFFQGTLRLSPDELQMHAVDPAAYGGLLCEALFAGPIGRAFERALSQARARPGGLLRVRLWLDDAAPELHGLPWERLYHYRDEQRVPLSVAGETPFSRYLGLGAPRTVALHPPLRLLFAAANPTDSAEQFRLDPFDVAAQVRALVDALAGLEQIQVTLLPGRSGLAGVDRALDPRRYSVESGPTTLERLRALAGAHQIVHFLGHGTLVSPRDGAALLLEREDGAGRLARPDEVTPVFSMAASVPRLVVLAACWSGSADAPFRGLGPRLVRAGVPAVVAMQEAVATDYARDLSACFYRRLLEHGVVDRALNEARYDVFKGQHDDWAVPVLYMRLEDGRLFAPDPLRSALLSMRDDEQFRIFREDYVDLPLTVMRLSVAPPEANPGGPPQIGVAQPFGDVVEEIFAPGAGPPRLAVLSGQKGTNKTTQLKHLVWRTIDSALKEPAPRLLPLYIDLGALEPARAGLSLAALVRETLRRYWPGAPDDVLDSRPGGFVLRLAFVGVDGLAEQWRAVFWKRLAALIQQYPGDQYLLATGHEHFLPDHQWHNGAPAAPPALRAPAALQARPLDIQLLLIQPLERRAIFRLLREMAAATGDARHLALLTHLERAQLLDLVSLPSLLVKIVKQARDGKLPGSRVEVLHGIVCDRLEQLPTRQGMRSHANMALCQLAWRMQTERTLEWPLTRTFELVSEIRGQRGYSLEQFVEALVAAELLAYVGDDALCFASAPVQAYYCALALFGVDNRERVLEDVTASLGRLTLLRWWREPLVTLCRLLYEDGQTQSLEHLLRMIVYGVNIFEGEQVFLAARCLAEIGGAKVAPDLQQRVTDALVWRLSAANEPRAWRRVNAARALGQLRDPDAIPALARAANKNVRAGWSGKPGYELSNVRMAAALALLQMPPEHQGQINALDPELAGVLRSWRQGDVPALIAALADRSRQARSLAAFALGDLQTAEAVDALVASFLDSSDSALWAITNALVLLDPRTVIERAVSPLLSPEGQAALGRNRILRRCLAYLIGRTQANSAESRAYLEECLRAEDDSSLKAHAMRALGKLYDYIYRDLFEEIAQGVFDHIPVAGLQERERTYLRRVAIETLATIGDAGTVTRLRASRRDGGQWPTELDQAFYHTSEEIAWRTIMVSAEPAGEASSGGEE